MNSRKLTSTPTNKTDWILIPSHYTLHTLLFLMSLCRPQGSGRTKKGALGAPGSLEVRGARGRERSVGYRSWGCLGAPSTANIDGFDPVVIGSSLGDLCIEIRVTTNLGNLPTEKRKGDSTAAVHSIVT